MDKLYNVDASNFVSEQLERRFTSEKINEKFKEQLKITMGDVDTFKVEAFEGFDVDEILIYLKASHKFYLGVWIPKLENTLLQMHTKMSNQFWSVKLLSLFLNAYKKELVHHIEEEEEILFAYVDRLLAGENSDPYKEMAISHFVNTHNDNVVIHLEDLKRDILTFDKELAGDLTFEVLFNQLSVFQEDLFVHGLIEDQVFLPKVLALAASK
ncbi:MAG: hemerythrin domain-containing protein [Crocinitomicaceae bacterium]